MEGVRSFTL